MSFLDNVGKKLSDAGQVTIQKTKNMADVAKYRSMISDEEKRISGLYEEIGRQYVLKYKEDPIEEFKDYIEEIEESVKKIADYEESIKNIKGVLKCPKCGAEIKADAIFCSVCGTKLVTEESVANEAAEEEPTDVPDSDSDNGDNGNSNEEDSQ